MGSYARRFYKNISIIYQNINQMAKDNYMVTLLTQSENAESFLMTPSSGPLFIPPGGGGLPSIISRIISAENPIFVITAIPGLHTHSNMRLQIYYGIFSHFCINYWTFKPCVPFVMYVNKRVAICLLLSCCILSSFNIPGIKPNIL